MYEQTQFNPHLLKAARLLLAHGGNSQAAMQDLLQEKIALVPAGGGAPGGDPAAAGGAPPMDPSAAGGMPPGMDPSAMGGAAPPPGGDPAAAGGPMPPAGPMAPDQLAQIGQQVSQMLQQAGGAGAGGKGGGKKAEQQMLSAQIRNLTYLVAQIAQKLDIQIPPTMLVGPPNDPMIEQQAQQDLQMSAATPTLAAAAPQAGMDPAAAGAMPDASGGAASMGGAPKTASALGDPYDPGLHKVSSNAAVAAILIQRSRGR